MTVLQNLMPNPEFAVNITDGWTFPVYETRDDDPPVPLPDGCAAAMKIMAIGGATNLVASSNQMAVTPGVLYWMSAYLYRPGGYAEEMAISFWGPTSGWTTTNFYSGTPDDVAFVRRYGSVYSPDDAVGVQIRVLTHECVDNTRAAWVTGFMLQPCPDEGDIAAWADGDSATWEWDGDAHNSASRSVDTAETYDANVLINGGASVVFERDVTLALNPGSVAATEMAVRNDEDGYGAWEAFAATKAWTLSAACKVWAKFRDGA